MIRTLILNLFTASVTALLMGSVLLTGSVSVAMADAVVITDAAGVERASVESVDPQKVEFTVTTTQGVPAEAAEVTLTNSATGEVITTQSVAGVASFEGIAPGAWIVSSSTPGVVFTNIQIGGLAAASGATSMTVGGVSIASAAGGAVAIGGVTAAAIALSDDDNNNDGPLSPST